MTEPIDWWRSRQVDIQGTYANQAWAMPTPSALRVGLCVDLGDACGSSSPLKCFLNGCENQNTRSLSPNGSSSSQNGYGRPSRDVVSLCNMQVSQGVSQVVRHHLSLSQNGLSLSQNGYGRPSRDVISLCNMQVSQGVSQVVRHSLTGCLTSCETQSHRVSHKL